ncbi:MAG: MCP four helix bundle domain-containing protein [Planctomycetaceae bacterium]|nr:MCP four helix bundle domain-containing protein [Planctomycetaceae bacterium]
MQWFLNRKTMTKLILGFSTVCAIVAGMGSIGGLGITSVRENLRVVYEDYTVAATELARVSSAMTRFRAAVALAVSADSKAEFAEHATQQDKLKPQMLQPLEKYSQTVLRVSRSGRNERQDLEQFRAALAAYFAAADQTRSLLEQRWEARTDAEIETLKNKAQENIETSAGPKLMAAVEHFDHLLETVSDVASDMNEDGKATASKALWTIVVGTGLSVLVSLALGYFIARIVSRPLTQAVGILESVAHGDFTQRLDLNSRDEVGQMAKALNDAIASVRTTLEEVQQVSGTVAGASQQLSAASQEISSGAQEQASNLEETASSLEEITSTIKQNSDNAQQANQLAVGAREVAEKGGQVVASAIDGMTEINRSSKKIAEIITAIDEIAFQTNLLALNAAVEAARAGEQGRGFAVVAGEVRNLAQRSAAAAKEIKELIQDSVRKVETGSELVNKSGQTLQEIVTSVKRVTDIVSEIAAASREQSSGIDQVSRAVAQMDQVTQANASQTEELSGTAESLSGQASLLQEVVSRFKLSDDARPATRSTPAPVAKVAPTAPARKSPKATNGKATNGKHTNGKAATNGHATHELDLVGAGAGRNRLNGHFEEF